MADTIQQAKDLISKSDRITIIPVYDLQGDAFAAGLALFYTLRKLDKKINFAAQKTPKQLEFLRDDDAASKEVMLTINSQGKEFKQMRYEKNAEELKIYLALSKGDIAPADISIRSPDSHLAENTPDPKTRPNLIIAIGAQNMEQISSQTELEPSRLYEIPILNIDNQIINEAFGNLNLIDHGAASLSEIITDLIIAIKPDLLSGQVCTKLLAGLICATNNFQHPRTSPRTLSKAALLIEHGADHEKIIQHLYKTKTLAQMRLLGRALQNLRLLPDKELGLITLTKDDFDRTGASSRDLAQVLEDIRANFPQLPSLFLLWESHASDPLVKGIASCKNSVIANKILENFEGTSRHNTVLFLIRERDLKRAEQTLTNLI